MVNVQTIANQVNQQVRNREAAMKRNNDAVGREHVVKGQFMVDGTGESVAVLNFPVLFIEKPIATFGWELYPGQGLTAGEFPTASTGVADWALIEKTPRVYYVGATVATVSTGPTGQRLFINYRFEGRAITNPVNPTETSDTVV